MEAIIAACIAAFGAVLSAVFVVVGSRGPLHRLDVVSRALAGMTSEDPAYKGLVEVRRVDAESIGRAQMSTLKYFVGLWIALSLVTVVTGSFGTQISNRSPLLWYILVMTELALVVVLVVVLIAAAVGVLSRRLKRRGASVA
ncbi:hypothetical protein ACFPJ4_11890 [Lysinimonas soli]|uniref:DUF2721 domain-containing protein n=1 Tax=Lysinimonas soli TaxID=1074233 RepID=A0ABW0NR69_9MICO